MSVTLRAQARALVFVCVPIFRYHNDLILTNYELKSHFFISSTILIPILFPTVLSVSFQFHLSLNTAGNLLPLLITILYCQFGLKREIFKIFFQLFTGFLFAFWGSQFHTFQKQNSFREILFCESVKPFIVF